MIAVVAPTGGPALLLRVAGESPALPHRSSRLAEEIGSPKPKPNFDTIAKLIRKVFEVDPDSAIETFRRVEPYAKDSYPEHERQHLCYQSLSRARLNAMLMDHHNTGKWYKTTLSLLDNCPSYSASAEAIREEASRQLSGSAA